LKKKWSVNDSIQWVIDALDNSVVEKKDRENHKYDEVRADFNLKWCPLCECKWEISYGLPLTKSYGKEKYAEIALPSKEWQSNTS